MESSSSEDDHVSTSNQNSPYSPPEFYLNMSPIHPNYDDEYSDYSSIPSPVDEESFRSSPFIPNSGDRSPSYSGGDGYNSHRSEDETTAPFTGDQTYRPYPNSQNSVNVSPIHPILTMSFDLSNSSSQGVEIYNFRSSPSASEENDRSPFSQYSGDSSDNSAFEESSQSPHDYADLSARSEHPAFAITPPHPASEGNHSDLHLASVPTHRLNFEDRIPDSVISAGSSNVTPPMAKIRKTEDCTAEPQSKTAASEDEEDSQTCPICYEPWGNSGDHRLVALRCGHLFGFQCIMRWLTAQRRGCRFCPTCKTRAHLKDVINIYARRLVAVDTYQITQLQRRIDVLEAEKNCREERSS